MYPLIKEDHKEDKEAKITFSKDTNETRKQKNFEQILPISNI